jgi:Na+-translocating ferredoxin:NAD+ oxidoreductase RnfG subunit
VGGDIIDPAMTSRITWIAVATATAVSPAFAATYLNVEQAQRAIFPGAKLNEKPLRLSPEQRKSIENASGVKVRVPEVKVWSAPDGGWFIIDEVIGKHEFITYALGLNREGAVVGLEVMDYRENYGSEVRQSTWRSQFVGKKYGARLKLTEDIKNISGATLSCRHIAEGVKRLLATHELVLKK